MHIECVGIPVTDFDRSVKFYTEFLGLKGGETEGHDAIRNRIWVPLQDPTSGHKLELNWYPAGSRHAAPYVPGEALDHIGFIVDTVEATFPQLVEREAQPVIDPSEGEGWTAFVKHSDVHWIEVYQLTEPGRRERFGG